MTPRHDARLVPAALGAWAAAAAVLHGFPVGFAVAVTAGIAGGGLLLLARVGAPAPWPGVRAAGASLGLALVAASAAGITTVTHAEASRRAVPEAVVESHEVLLRGTVDGVPRQAVIRGAELAFAQVRLTAWTTVGDAAATWVSTGGTVTVVVDADALARDDAILVRADVDRDEDGGVIAWDAEVVDRAPGTGPWADARRWVGQAAQALPVETAGLVQGMVTGDTSRMPAYQVDAMRVSGLAHLTAVSGAHFAVLTLLVSAATAWLRVPRQARAVAVAGAATSFALLVGQAPSVARAVVMALVVAGAMALGRRARGLPALSAAVLAVVLVAPEALRTGGLRDVGGRGREHRRVGAAGGASPGSVVGAAGGAGSLGATGRPTGADAPPADPPARHQPVRRGGEPDRDALRGARDGVRAPRCRDRPVVDRCGGSVDGRQRHRGVAHSPSGGRGGGVAGGDSAVAGCAVGAGGRFARRARRHRGDGAAAACCAACGGARGDHLRRCGRGVGIAAGGRPGGLGRGRV
nr:ComEC/Rec2 family competence protein [Demequina litorisediminis]